MGRSKFPGKPSKSINRKRISVLQLESNSPQNCNTSSSNTTAATTTAAAAATATANSTDTTTSAAANNSNTEEEDEQHHHHRRQRQTHNETQTQTATSTSTPTSSSSPTTDEENLSALSCSQDISFIHDQKRNGRRDDDDEDDENHQGGVGGGAATSSSNNSSSSCNSTNGQHQGDTSNNNNSNGNKSDTQGQHDSSNSSSSSNTNTDSTKSPSKNTKSDIETESEKEDEEEQQQPQDADDSNVNKYKQNKKACANNIIKQAATNLAVVATAHIKRKKFKNLNINKPEVMLPSSTKLKLQQQQCTLSVVAANSTTSLTTTPALLTTASAATKATSLSTATTTTTTALSASSTVLSSSIDSITTNHNQNNLNVAAADIVDDIDVAKGNNEHNNNNNNNDNNNDDDDAVKKNNISSNNNSVIAKHAADEKAAVVAVVAAVAASNDRCHDHIDDNNKSHNNNNSTSNEAKSGQNSPSNSLTHNGTTSEAASEKYSDITTITTATTITKINEDEESPTTTLSNSGTNATLQNNSPSHKMDCTTNAILTQNGTEDATSQSATQSCSSTTLSAASSAASAGADKKQKKTVTFKNVLETSDDKSVVKRFYNPDNRKPLLSIIKKECLNRPLMYTRNSDCIVRPSRLTEILKNNSNIDKLNALKFRCNKEEPAKTSVLDGPLSRVFGAPIQDDEDNDGTQQQQQQQDKTKYSMINFRLTNPPSDEEHEEEEEEEDDEDEEDDDEDEEEEEAEDEEKQQLNAAEEQAQQPELKAEQKNGKLEDDDNNEILQQEQKIKLLEENKSKIVKQNGLNKAKATNDTSKLETAELAKDIIKQDDEQQQMIVDKHFVLPKRSSRSSRVIKPNKRLIEDGIICKKPAATPAKPSPSATAKAIPKELTTTPTAAATNYFGLDKNDTAIGCSAAATSAVFPSTNIFANFGSIAGGVQSNSSSCSSSTAAALGKTSSFVLRQPRLQFDSSSVLSSSNAAATATATAAASITSDLRTNPSAVAAALALTASLPKSLQQAISSGAANNATGGLSSGSLLSPTFSLNGTSSLINPLQSASKATNNLTAATVLVASTPAVSTATTTSSLLSQPCVVCCSAINSKHLPQASKYGELSCEYCRKFISKIAKKSLAMKASAAASAANNVAASKAMLQLQCKADGNCIIAPQANKAGHMKNFKKVYKERCGYCWLKKCLQTLQLPKVRLNAVLPLLPLNTNGCTAATKSAISPAIKYSLQDMKIRKELDLNAATTKLITADGQQIKWKALQEQTAASCALTASAAAAATTTTNSLVDSMKLNSLKSNPLTVNVTFGSAPLLRPAILEKPLFPKTAIEMKQEKLDRMMEKKPLEVVTSFKTEALPLASETSPQSAARTKKSRDKLMLDKEARKELKIKEQISPKLEHKLTDMITPKQEELSPGNEASAQSAAVNAMLSLATEQQQIAAAAAVEQPALATASSLSPSTAEKRQRIDLKGPRVKHVCRSASIVLGQPLALFGEDGEETQLTAEELEAAQGQSSDGIKLTDENDNCTSCKTQETDQAEKSIIAGSTEQSISEPPLKTAKIETVTTRSSSGLSANVGNQQKTISAMTQQKPHHYNTHLSSYKKSTSLVASNALALPAQQRRKEPRLKCKLMISIDFWENYDPAEVCQTGFGLIITETVAQRALCFLCGSAGQEPMLFCSCCCEPYHQYCIQDEFNLKHSSLDDTLLLNESCLSVTGQQNSSQLSSAIAKLNWLCPRCTVCYTCNMSSGAKVRCQKCQKNYHSTCLGTSKRLLGADRPLICVNCLKCRSCSTTKVSKFVGNLPMCTNCFKLRKKGNYCPVCQKCYDDQDFDLKMMECGDCNQWVHAKCETLSDEQYNLLSTLPESIEFICKRCSRKSQEAKDRAQEWREAVREEFKSNLMSVLKLLSKSRQACALLRLSPRKQLKCCCAGSSSAMAQNKYAPKSLQFSLNEQSRNETASTIDVYEFSDREREVESPLPLQQQQQLKKCSCQPQQSSAAAHLSLVEIKQKICSGSYVTLAEFNYDMNLVIQQAYCDDLVIAYKEILSEQFPWFQNETQACTDALEEDMNESAGVYGLNSSLDSESDFNMDCMPHSQHRQQQQQHDHLSGNEALERSALLTELPQDLEDIVCNLKSRLDSRICLFCRRTGEGMVGEEARLLYCGHDCWVHTNCALWSAEVFEEIDGSLQNVHSAVARGRMIKCSVCGNRGATVGCNVKSCGEHYHYPCARSRNCAFLSDKSMYCPSHATPQYIRVPQETQFEVTRPVYVELERKRKKLVEPSKVQFHIGSLEVKQLGQIMPKFSDTYESLVPVNFLCSRLYWSSKEPWKIVEYSVRTYIHNSSSTALSAGAIDLGKNFTVDHTQQDGMRIQMGLTQIQQWHQSLSKSAAAAAAHQHDSSYAQELDYFHYQQQSSSMTTSSSSVALTTANVTQESAATATDEEPQTNADLLPPEIKDAIFEDCCDILEGISMLDIFTKCMNYEDMAQSEQSKDGVPCSDDDTMNSIGALTKQFSAELNSSWSSTAANNNNHCLEDSHAAAAAAQTVKLQRLKKSASPALSCDVNNKAAAIKRRKISENMLLTLNQQRTQKKEASSTNPANSKRSFTWSAEKRYNNHSNDDNNKLKLMQVDGADDSITEYRIVTQDPTTGTVKCERCQCSYRNLDSFHRHLSNCEPLSTSNSESDSENVQHQSQDLLQNINAQTLTLEQLQELQAKLQQQQQRQATATSMPSFIQTIPTQTFSQLQGLQQTSTLPLQFQNVQNLQNLQNLQQLQQQLNQQAAQQQQQPLAGNFFISTAQPDITASTPDLQMYASGLQGLNLNGTFTLQPQTHYANQSLAQNQPQLIAVSTNPDGTQHIIQLPAAASSNTQHHSTVQLQTPTYQTLQATNSDKKIVLPVGGGKPLKTMATKAAQQAAAKNKLKATTAVKPIQSKLNSAATATATIQPQSNTVNASQLLNQQILQQLAQQQAQQQAAASSQPQLLFQTANGHTQQPQLIMQQPQNIISFVTTGPDGSQQPQLQYVTLPATQTTTEFKPQLQTPTLFATSSNAQPIMQSAYLQADGSGNFVLTQGPPPQANNPTALQIISTPQGPQVIGTLIQPQTLQLQGGNIITTTTTATAENGLPQAAGAAGQPTQQQVLISGTPTANANGLEMLSATGTPQVILASAHTNSQPMYYGLETIVQNTVMSSQQFVSTAMPGVLSQNASFSATTTQVFQASKIEPLVDIPAGYVLLNNVDGSGTTLLQQQPNASTVNNQANQNNLIQAALQQQAAAAAAASMANEQQQQQQQQQHAQNSTVFSIQTPPVSAQQQAANIGSFQLHTTQATGGNSAPQILLTQAQPQTGVHVTNSTQFVDANGMPQLISAKVAPQQVAAVKRTKPVTPVAVPTVSKVQPQVVNKVMPNVAQINQNNRAKAAQLQQQQQQQAAMPPPQHHVQKVMSAATTQPTAQQQQTQQIFLLNKPQQQPAVLKQQQQQQPIVLSSPAAPAMINVKKTNLIKPLNKMEVKPKQMKTAAAATVVTKPTVNTNSLSSSNSNPTAMQNMLPAATAAQIAAINNKMVLLKPQQQQPVQKQQQQQQPLQQNTAAATVALQQPIQDSNIDNISNHAAVQQPANPLQNDETKNSLIEFVNLQHVANQHQQHYNVADALLLDDSSQLAQQNLSHCSYSAAAAFETQSNNNQTAASATNDNLSNILPTIQRMPQYPNVNIVNPLQQYSSSTSSSASSATTSSSSSTTSTTTVTRPTNRVLPMQQKHSEQHTISSTCSSSSLSTYNTNTNTTTTAHISSSANNNGNSLITEASTIKANINKMAYEAEVKQMLMSSPNPQIEQQQQQTQQLSLNQQQQQHELHQNQIINHIAKVVVNTSPNYDISEKTELSESDKLQHQHLTYVGSNGMADYEEPEECLASEPKFPPEGELLLGSDCCDTEEDCMNSIQAEEGDLDNDMDDDEDEDDGFSLKMPSANGSDNLSMDSDEPAVKEKISKILDNLTNEEGTDSLNANSTLEARMDYQQQQHHHQHQTAAEMQQQQQQHLLQQQQQQHNQSSPQQIVSSEYYTPTEEESTAYLAAQLAENIKQVQQAASAGIADFQMTESNQEKLQIALPSTDYLGNCAVNHQQDPLLPDAASDSQQLQQQLSAPAIMSFRNPQPPPPAQQPPSRDPKKISGPHLLYEIQSEDGFTYKSSSISEVWEKVFEAVQVARRAHGLSPLPDGPLADMSGVQMIGLKTNALKYLIEQLPGVEKCAKYTPKYHKRNGGVAGDNSSSSSSYSSSGIIGAGSAALSIAAAGGAISHDIDDASGMDYASDQEELQENPYDSARCEPFAKRSEYDMFSWLASRHRKQPVQVFVQPSDNELVPRRGTGSNLPMAMKYRTLKETYKDYVGVFRSHIHGRGLYCTKDIEAGEMVIEYAGELIRSTLTDQRERYYNSRGIGCYMFKIDDNLVVDATMRGNAARFINHSCEPNCYSKVVDILGHKHIIIFALRRIVQGEELTYDYKFPFEDEKIPCSCSSKKCRKYLN